MVSAHGLSPANSTQNSSKNTEALKDGHTEKLQYHKQGALSAARLCRQTVSFHVLWSSFGGRGMALASACLQVSQLTIGMLD